MDFRRRIVLVILTLFTSAQSEAGLFTPNNKIYFPIACEELSMNSETLLKDAKDLSKVAAKRGKLMARIKRNQDLVDSGILLEEYFRKRGLKVNVRNLATTDIEGVYNAVRSDVFSMTSMYFEAKIYADKIAALTKELGTVEKAMEKNPELFKANRVLIVQMTEHFENYKIVTQFLRKATGLMTETKEGVTKVIDYSEVLISEYIRRKAWQAEIEGKVLDATSAELRAEAIEATAGLAAQYKQTSRKVLDMLAPDASGGLAKEYRNAYPRSLNADFTRIPYYTEIRDLIETAGMDMSFYLLKRQDWYQRLAVWALFRPTRLANAGLKLIAKKLPKSKWANVDAFVYSLENLESIAAHDSAIQGVIDFKGSLVDKGYELLARNGDKENAMIVRFATRDDLAWEWEMIKLAAEKATPPSRRVLAKMTFAEKIAAKLDGSSGKPASAQRRIIDKAIDTLILGGGGTIAVGYATFGKAEITTDGEEDDNTVEPSPSPEVTPDPEVTPEEKNPNESPDENPNEQNKKKKPIKDAVKDTAFDAEVLRRVKARFKERPPIALTSAEVIQFDQILNDVDPILYEYLKVWVKSGHKLDKEKAATH